MHSHRQQPVPNGGPLAPCLLPQPGVFSVLLVRALDSFDDEIFTDPIPEFSQSTSWRIEELTSVASAL
ncbi:hypothetical protein RSOLAG1IB_04595 [Rhizoctonia solani AG-1 IB]|uniref:Uncharacterized protein n=1 Tax=Thanatephorus cucumeris (strain AG1-IB / isolate 7/3/14) TaxID=1108050 RepID=A0A0B7FVW8_THACB|nr:hypothetical protein RSOLAG1IB_04595 [Rhizoctonia solani AG-1 IB]